MPKHKNKKDRTKTRSLAGVGPLMSLTGFRATTIPDVECLKFVYSDYRVLTAAVNQAEYVYRLNSLFDPDQSGVGGQPDGFDQWKALYGIYRVVAAKVKVSAVGNGANTNGLLAVAPSDTAGGFNSAEEVAALRRAKGGTFSQTDPAIIKSSYHMSQLLGRTDEAVLGDNECAALVTANPNASQYLVVAVETGNSATGQTMTWVEITYYARMERPIATLDTSTRHRLAFQSGRIPRSLTAGGSTTTAAAESATAAAPRAELVTQSLSSTALAVAGAGKIDYRGQACKPDPDDVVPNKCSHPGCTCWRM